ncbi:MAG: Uncharacterised protein [Rhodospirillaceae bacterium]|nr:MAG: Uncharacterised protein [Rhodospirillaceae bacterium]
MEIFLDQAVGGRGGEGHPAVHLWHGDLVGHGRKRDQHLIRRLHVQTGPVDSAPIQPCWRSGFEAAQREPKTVDGLGQRHGRRFPGPPLKGNSIADKGLAAQEGAGGDHKSRRCDLHPPIGGQPDHRTTFVKDNVVGPGLDHGQPALCLQQGLDGLAVQAPVGLRSRSPDRRALGGIKHAELDTRLVDGTAHQAIERINFPDQMTLTQTADRGVTRHLTHRLPLVGHQPDLCPQPRSGGGGLGASVPTADDDHVEAQARGQGVIAGVEFHVKQLLKG